MRQKKWLKKGVLWKWAFEFSLGSCKGFFLSEFLGDFWEWKRGFLAKKKKKKKKKKKNKKKKNNNTESIIEKCVVCYLVYPLKVSLFFFFG